MSDLLNRLEQMLSVTWFNLRTIPQRRSAVISTAVGIAGVAAVFAGVLSIAAGFRAAMATPGQDDIAIVLRGGADSEMTSFLVADEVRLIRDAPGAARVDDNPMIAAELFVMITLTKRTTGSDANVPMRGVQQGAWAIRGDMKLLEGRMFEPGRNEVIVGVGAARSCAGLDVGNTVRIGQNQWRIVGIFSGGGGAAESELWTDAAVLQPAYHRGTTYQSVSAKLASPAAFDQFSQWLTRNPRLNVRVLRKGDFLAEQSAMLTSFIETIGVFIAGMMALGALFGALNTMYSAVAARTVEIATLRALGFGPGPIVLSILLESLAVALAGGVTGAGLAYLAFDGYQAATLNWQTFSQIAFAFKVTPGLLGAAIIWAAAIGLLGGLFPALRAARLPVATALRET